MTGSQLAEEADIFSWRSKHRINRKSVPSKLIARECIPQKCLEVSG
jgi:hypothetical protein